MAAIQVENLNFVYSPKTPFAKDAVKDVSLNVEEGEFFGIIGHTGSGKSTLVQHFNGLIPPGRGKVTVLGIDTSDRTQLKNLRSQAGMVFQYPEHQLFAETVFDDVAFGLKNFHSSGKDNPLTPEQTERAVKDAITMVGLDYETVKSRSPFDLSGGQKRRVALAGVIVTRPKILILDEPTAGLDPAGKREILALIHKLKKLCSPTIIMIGHDMNEIAENCTRICVLSEGRVLCVLPPQQLFLRAEELLNQGLELPATVRIALKLRKLGMDIPPTLFTPKELADAVASAMLGARAEKGGTAKHSENNNADLNNQSQQHIAGGDINQDKDLQTQDSSLMDGQNKDFEIKGDSPKGISGSESTPSSPDEKEGGI